MIINKTNYWRKILVLLTGFLTVFFLLLASPLSPWGNNVSTIDSSVYQLVARYIDRGYMPYKDTFDHKGPLLYLINYLGFKINFKWGLWLIEFAFMLVSFLTFFAISKLFNKSYFVSTLSTLFVFANIFIKSIFWTGNTVEEYALTFIAISLYLFTDYICNNKINKFRIALCGFCFACVFMLKLNAISLWIVFCLAILIKEIINKNFVFIRQMIIYFLLGMSVVIIPILTWLYNKGAIKQFGYCYFKFNSLYTNYLGGLKHIKRTMRTGFSGTFSFFVYLLLLLGIALLILFKTKHSNLLILNAITLFLSVFFISLPGRTTYLWYYLLVTFPLYIIPSAMLFNNIFKKFKHWDTKSICSMIIISISIILLSITFLEPPFSHIQSIQSVTYPRNSLIEDTIDSYTNEDDKITIFGENKTVYYLLSNRFPATKYSYMFPINLILPSFTNEFWEDLNNNKPELIVSFDDLIYEQLQTFIEENNYQLIEKLNTNEINGAFGIMDKKATVSFYKKS